MITFGYEEIYSVHLYILITILYLHIYHNVSSQMLLNTFRTNTKRASDLLVLLLIYTPVYWHGKDPRVLLSKDYSRWTSELIKSLYV